MGFFGTDGVRGKSSAFEEGDPVDIFEQKMIFTPELCGMLALSASNSVGPGSVIVGWDRRPKNELYAELVVEKLSNLGRDVLVIGESCTPALQYTMIARNAALGIMITASHNPSEDTGIKVILQGGRKPSELEESIIESGIGHLNQNGGSQTVGSVKHIVPFEYLEYVRGRVNEIIRSTNGMPKGLLIDGSSGWISSWLSKMLTAMGQDCIEVSNRELEINHNCGAGNLYEGLTATWLDCKESEHALLNQVDKKPRGAIIGFSFDGDGDRCMMIVSKGDGIEVVGGDGFLRLYSKVLDVNEEFSLAYTIESSLDIPGVYKKFVSMKLTETGVGDRQLQHALLSSPNSFMLGAEPSGHVILEHKHEYEAGLWGDGVITMLEFLRIGTDLEFVNSTILDIDKGINRSKSVFPSNRDLWRSDNNLAREAVSVFSNLLGINIEKVDIKEVKDSCETLILNVSGMESWSLTIRNSGTEQKTRLTLRSTKGSESLADDILNQVFDLLEGVLKLNN